jgi:hypothetical protein
MYSDIGGFVGCNGDSDSVATVTLVAAVKLPRYAPIVLTPLK